MGGRSVDREGLVARLRAGLRPDQVTATPADRAVYSYDATWTEGWPDVVVHAESTADVAFVLRVAQDLTVPVVPRGGGTGLAGGSVPVGGGICLNLVRMNRILAIDPADGVAVVQPGVITYDLQRAVEAWGLFYPPDPASLYMSTIGGNVATNAGGPRCLKYGVTRDYVLGLVSRSWVGTCQPMARKRSRMAGESGRALRWGPQSPLHTSPRSPLTVRSNWT